MKNLKVLGIYPISALNHILKLYDEAPADEKVKLLVNQRGINIVPSNAVPKRFSSKQMVDISAGEMLSLGVVAHYFNLVSVGSARTYQAVVGVEDSLKTQVENFISDGAIWDDVSAERMPFQQTLIQGYLPRKRVISSQDVIKAINAKIRDRSNYPKHCGLIVSVYGELGVINFKEIIESCKLAAYDVVYVVAYEMPEIGYVTVTLLEESMPPDVFIANQKRMNLARTEGGPWLVNESLDKVTK